MNFQFADNLWAAGLFLAIAVVLCLCWLLMTWWERRANWPMYLLGMFGLAVWLIAAVGLFWDGELGAGFLLTGVVLALLLAAAATFLINEHGWLVPAGFALLGVGALIDFGDRLGPGLAIFFAVTLICLVSIVFLSGSWWPPVAYSAAALQLLALGSAIAPLTSKGADLLWRNVTSIRANDPWWLLVLLLIPLTVWWSFDSLAGLGTVRRWVALGLRCALLLFLGLALADVYLQHTNDTVTVLFLWDRSLSMPEDETERHLKFINDSVRQRGPKHQRDQVGLIPFARYPRLELTPKSVPHLGLKKTTSDLDKTYTNIGDAIKLALASFPEGTGKRIVLICDGNENLGNAEEQARIAKQNGVEIDTVLVGAGYQRENEVLVERVEAPTPSEADQQMEVRIIVRSYFSRPVIGWLRLTKTVVRLPTGDDAGQVNVFETQPTQQVLVRVRKGLTPFFLKQPGLTKKESYSYKAEFVPLAVEKEPVDLEALDPKNIANDPRLDIEAVKGDRPQNNEATTSVLAQGEKKVLLIEPTLGDHSVLINALRTDRFETDPKTGKPVIDPQTKKPRIIRGLQVGAITPGQLPTDMDKLNFFLTSFDCIILANVPYGDLKEQDLALRLAVHEQGCGLIMIGGPNGYGAGGWQNSEVEKALPVTCELKSLKVEGRSGLVLIMHASEIAEGNMWQKKIAQLAIEKLSPYDMLGMLYYDGTPDHKWHIPFQTVGENKGKMLALVDKMWPGDMLDVKPSLKKAYDALSDPVHKLGTKHVIFISDGDHWGGADDPGTKTWLDKFKQGKITLSTVCITSHGQGEYKRMKGLVDAVEWVDNQGNRVKGRSYPPPNADGSFTPIDPNQLPAIYMKETRLISKSYFYDKPFTPQLLLKEGPTEGLPNVLPDLYGFVRTTPRGGPLVKLPIMSPKLGDNPWPILGYWQYGLGKGVAFTSDTLTRKDDKGQLIASWGKDWLTWDKYAAFWQQLVHWSLRSLENNKNLKLNTEVRDGKVLITVDARDDDKKPITDLDVVLRVTSPTPKAADVGRADLKMEQKNIGRYVAEWPATDVGSYILTVMAYRSKRVAGPDGVERSEREPFGLAHTVVTIPHSREFSEMAANPDLLKQLSELTGGKAYLDDEDVLKQVATSSELFRASPARTRSLQSIWYWLLALTGIGLFFDVAVRRIAVDPSQGAVKVQEEWQRLRGLRAAAPTTSAVLDRLKTRKEQVGESIEREKAARRFEGEAPAGAAPPVAGTGPLPSGPKPPPRPTQGPSVGPEAQGETAADYASRLLRAKKRAMQDRDKDNPPK
jgi:uncharacterized membrane protein